MSVNVRGYQLHVALAACILVVALGLGARQIVQGRQAAVLEHEFASIAGVEAAEVVQRGGHTYVLLTVANVDDFPRLYQQAEQLRSDLLPGDASRIIVRDGRTDHLIDSWRLLHFAVYEGAATGRFTAMAEAVQQLASRLPVDQVQLTMDGRYIYVRLTAGDAYMYELVPLTPQLVADPTGGERPQ